MSFLNQLKSQARALQSQRTAEEQVQEQLVAETEQACELISHYFGELARQLSVIEPPGPALSLDGRTPWPAMKLVDFRVDARRKVLRDREVFDYIAMGWRIVPQPGEPTRGAVSVNFPTEMQRVEDKLMMGPVKNERYEVRDPERGNVLREVRYEYQAQTRGSVTATPEHERGVIHFRLLNTSAFEVVQASVPAARITHDELDELAKRIVGQPSAFI